MIKKRLSSVVVVTTLLMPIAGSALDRSPTPKGAEVYFLSPANGETVTSPVTVVFGLAGMGVAPAGTDAKDTGHHHLIINAPFPDPSLPIPADDNHKHFGNGQTQTTIDLPPGTHTLQLLLGNFIHVPHADPITSDVIEITVK